MVKLMEKKKENFLSIILGLFKCLKRREVRKMKRIVIATIMVLLAIGITVSAHADELQTSAVSATVASEFSLAFYSDANIVHGATVPFGVIDPAATDNLPSGRTSGDGLSDVGLLCTSNAGNTWYLKIDVNGLSPLAGKLDCYMGQPWDRNVGGPASGGLTYGDWFTIATAPETVYTAGAGDVVNTPFGTLATLSLRLDGTGLTDGAYSATVTYTLTETP